MTSLNKLYSTGFASAFRTLALGLMLSGALAACSASNDTAQQSSEQSVYDYNAALVASDERLLKLEGSSNFRDMGGYKTEDGKTVRRDMLFRSGAMTSLSEEDIAYLNAMNFSAVVDLRSSDELDLYPNSWVKSNASIDYLNHEYDMMTMMGKAYGERKSDGEIDRSQTNFADMMPKLYRHLPQQLAPQLRLYFAELLETDSPVVVNCSAGQDRTGIASAVVLSALGVPRQTIIEDYLLSTQYRRPANEKGDVDLQEAAKTNDFAKMMLKYSKGEKSHQPNPLYTSDGTPFLVFALDEIEMRYGSIESYLDQVIGVDAEELSQLREKYLL